MLVVYGHGQTRICGGGARWCYRKSRDRKWRQSPEVAPTGSHVTESAPTGSMLCACATGSCALVGPPEVTSVTWPTTWPEEALSGSVRRRNRKLRNRFPRYFSYSSTSTISRVFFLSTSTMVTEGHPRGCAQPQVAQPEVGYRKWGFPAIFPCSSWGVLYDVRV